MLPVLQTAGIERDEARRRIFMVDSKGLITTTRGDKLPEHKQRYARDDGTPDMKVGCARRRPAPRPAAQLLVATHHSSKTNAGIAASRTAPCIPLPLRLQDLKEIVAHVKPHALIGLSGAPCIPATSAAAPLQSCRPGGPPSPPRIVRCPRGAPGALQWL